MTSINYFRNIWQNLDTKRRALRVSPWIIWGLGATFFFAEYYARVSPSVMVPDLMHAFNASAFELGSLSAFFYFSYTIMQIPVGVLVDRFGARRLLLLTALLCGFGSLLFATAQSLQVADLGRLLMGFGAAFAFVGAMKLASVWFPVKRFGLLAGLTQAVGMFGAAVGEAPMAISVGHFGWRITMLMVAATFILLAFCIGLFVRDNPSGQAPTKHTFASSSAMLQGFSTVLKNPQTWMNGLFIGLLYAPTAAFGELWGVDFLVKNYSMSRNAAAFAIDFVFFGWAIGGPLAGWLSDRMQLRKPIMQLSALCGFLTLAVIIYVPHLPVLLLFGLLFIYGFTNTGVGVSYALSGEINPHRVAGTSIAFSNMASIAVGGFLFQPLIGKLLDMFWDGTMVNGVPFYAAEYYRWALAILPFCCLLSFLCCFRIKETHCQQKM